MPSSTSRTTPLTSSAETKQKATQARQAQPNLGLSVRDNYADCVEIRCSEAADGEYVETPYVPMVQTNYKRDYVNSNPALVSLFFPPSDVTGRAVLESAHANFWVVRDEPTHVATR